jgi:hypothetical protein
LTGEQMSLVQASPSSQDSAAATHPCVGSHVSVVHMSPSLQATGSCTHSPSTHESVVHMFESLQSTVAHDLETIAASGFFLSDETCPHAVDKAKATPSPRDVKRMTPG